MARGVRRRPGRRRLDAPARSRLRARREAPRLGAAGLRSCRRHGRPRRRRAAVRPRRHPVVAVVRRCRRRPRRPRDLGDPGAPASDTATSGAGDRRAVADPGRCRCRHGARRPSPRVLHRLAAERVADQRRGVPPERPALHPGVGLGLVSGHHRDAGNLELLPGRVARPRIPRRTVHRGGRRGRRQRDEPRDRRARLDLRHRVAHPRRHRR